MVFHRAQVSTNAFVGVYIDRLLEQQQLASGKEGRSSSTTSTTVTDDDDGSDDGEDNHHQRAAGTRGNHKNLVGLTFETFVHIFWVFSATASRAEKEEG